MAGIYAGDFARGEAEWESDDLIIHSEMTGKPPKVQRFSSDIYLNI